jgi:DNA-binding MarR family transcriptional regulator
MAPATFNFNGRRLDLAIVFRRACTAKEAARSLGVETGSIFGLIQRMTAEGIIEPTSLGEPTRGTEYVLTEDGAHALELELERSRDPEEGAGSVLDGQELIIARGGTLSRVQSVFADLELSRAVSWAATLGADWLLALSVDADKFAAQKLVVALEGAGCKCEYGKVDSMLSGRRLRERAADLDDVEVAK